MSGWDGIGVARSRRILAYSYGIPPFPTAIFDWITLDVPYGCALGRAGESEQLRNVSDEAERYAQARIEEGAREGVRYGLARINAIRGETDQAFRWLDDAIRFGTRPDTRPPNVR